MNTSDLILQWVAAFAVGGIACGVALIVPPSIRPRVWLLLLVGVVGAASIVLVQGFALGFGGGGVEGVSAFVLQAAFAGACAASVAALASCRLGPFAAAGFAAAWAAAVLAPVLVAAVGVVPSVVQQVFGAVDYAAVLASHVAAAASLMVIAMMPRGGHVVSAASAPSPSRALLAAALIVVGASAWMMGVEGVINDASGRIAVNAVAGLAIGGCIWPIMERIAGRPISSTGIVAGVLVSWAAVGQGVAFLSPAALGAAAVLGCASAAAVVVRRRPGANIFARYAISVIVATLVGGLVMALLADGFGMAATGSLSLAAGQWGGTVAVTVIAAGAALLFWGAIFVASALVRRLTPSDDPIA